MPNKPEWPVSVTGDDPRPTMLVLYRTPDRWRYAIYMDGVIDGWLEEGVDTPVGEAQEALKLMLERGIGRSIAADWVASEQPDWWTAEVTLLQ